METATAASRISSATETCDVEETMALLREQDVLYGRLELLAERQHRLIAGDAPEPLLAVLSERAEVSRGLARIAEKLAPSRANWAALRRRFNVVQRMEADQLLARTREKLSRLMASDDRDARLLSVRAGRVGEELRTSFRQGRAVEAYQADVRELGSSDADRTEQRA